MKCHFCEQESQKILWRLPNCLSAACTKAAISSPVPRAMCDFCERESTARIRGAYVCDNEGCHAKESERVISTFGNLAKTTFGSKTPTSFTAKQERRWADIAEATGFNQDGTMKV